MARAAGVSFGRGCRDREVIPNGGVLVAGNLVLDVVAMHSPDAVRWNTSVWIESIGQHLGGNGANSSYTIARLGVFCRLIGFVGRDAAGGRILEILSGAGVDAAHVARSHLPTASSVVLVREDGARAFLHAPGVSRAAFTDALDITPEMARGCRFFHLANPFGTVGLRSNGAALLQRARDLGLRTSLDAGWDSRGEWMRVIGPCLRWTDLLFVNAEEATQLTGMSETPDAARALLEAGAGTVVIKLGRRGCAVYSGGASEIVPGFRVNAVDTTGAGDCFSGAFLAGLARALPLVESARLANAAGALSVQQAGGTTGVLSFDETLAWMAGASVASAK